MTASQTPAGADAVPRLILLGPRRGDSPVATVGDLLPGVEATVGAHPLSPLCPGTSEEALRGLHARALAALDEPQIGDGGRAAAERNRLAMRRVRRALAADLVDPTRLWAFAPGPGWTLEQHAAALSAHPAVEGLWLEPGHLGAGPQGHLAWSAEAAPFGLGVASLHALGYTGRGARVVLLDQGFHAHIDLPHVPTLAGVVRPAEAWHGTAALGVVGAAGRGGHPVGAAPNATLAYASPWATGEFGAPEVAETVFSLLAQGRLAPGDVLLVQLQVAVPPEPRMRPVTAFDPWRYALAHAVALGVVVVAAAGNGGADLGSSASCPTGGVILVGAVGSQLGLAGRHRPLQGPLGLQTNIGRPIGLYGPGLRVPTLGGGPGTTEPVGVFPRFSGTSSAAAAIAGGLAVLQSAWMQATGDAPLNGPALLASARSAAAGGARVGLPDLHAVVRDVWRLSPRLKLGEIHTALLPGAHLQVTASVDAERLSGPSSVGIRVEAQVLATLPAGWLARPLGRTRCGISPERAAVTLHGGPWRLTDLPAQSVFGRDAVAAGAVAVWVRLESADDPGPPVGVEGHLSALARALHPRRHLAYHAHAVTAFDAGRAELPFLMVGGAGLAGEFEITVRAKAVGGGRCPWTFRLETPGATPPIPLVAAAQAPLRLIPGTSVCLAAGRFDPYAAMPCVLHATLDSPSARGVTRVIIEQRLCGEARPLGVIVWHLGR